MKIISGIFISLFIIVNSSLFAQNSYSFKNEFEWTDSLSKNNEFINRFIVLMPNEFQYYKLKEEYSLTINDLKKDLHIIDLNNDGLNDIIFDGQSGGEPREISIFINNKKTFEKVFTTYQGILKMEFQNNFINKINIKDWGCCAGIIVTNTFFNVKNVNNELLFEVDKIFKYIQETELPKQYWIKSKKIKILNDNYNLRSSPYLDNTTEKFLIPEAVYGNVVGKIKKESIGLAFAKWKDINDTTGRVWYFIGIKPEYDLRDTFFDNIKGEPKYYKCGWISNRYVEVIE